ncbi:XdhC family protein [Hyphococcus sp.]|uniref:XdhC family protein n=1 Tax=Hyphococcus sp. TaxID=2038636 RepID=UPI003CCB9186
MKSIYTENVLPHLQEWRQAGDATALVTLARIEGSSPRPLGSQMAVNDRGEAAGLITGGCAEAAIIAEAQKAIASGSNRCVRFGVGSPYMDIRLPCGSGIDVFFDVTIKNETISEILKAQDERRACAIAIDLTENHAALCPPQNEHPEDRCVKIYTPQTRLLIVGKGAIVPFAAQLAALADMETHIYSPEEETLEACLPYGAITTRLSSDREVFGLDLDEWTGVVTLFHEHEWELCFLQQAVLSKCFYIGALGSRRTHADRLVMLKDLGLREDQLKFIRGPVGLDIGAKSPPEIAFSIIAEIIEARREKL